VNEARRMLDLAARLALRGGGYVEPNPMVGAVIALDGQVIGLGHHKKFGGLHAEREALADCRRRGNNPRGATAFVTLEPCKHFGKQPPCTDALIEAGVARVVYAREDPAENSGGGASVLRARGIVCEQSGESRLALGISEPFIKRIRTGLPWVMAKWAQTLDGRLSASPTEDRWISGERARRYVHRVRARVDAVLTGIGTVLVDDPLLTARGVKIRRVAKRVIVDSHLRLPRESALVRSVAQGPVLVVHGARGDLAADLSQRRRALESLGVVVQDAPATGSGLDLEYILRSLLSGGAATVLVEAGPRLLRSFFDSGLVDEAIVHIAGAEAGYAMRNTQIASSVAPALADGGQFTLWRERQLGNDVELVLRRR
jgi:diaminohydroxyphosphoribosylaminopyrimidine deaminase/5-amino-6-(5-phosphoribosylamino)uracil reductase